jgi:tripartite-type tricarboxylate transporter receptor subunit TctC
MDRRQWLAGTAAVAAGGLWGTRALAQTAAPGLAGWPRQSIRWLVPYPPGGGTDVLAAPWPRPCAQHWASPS